MILAGLLLKLGSFGFFKVSVLICIKKASLLRGFYTPLALVGGVMTGLNCVRQTDVKALIAYSSVCHIRLILAGFLSFSFWGAFSSLLLILGHGLSSRALFYTANFYYERFFTRRVAVLNGFRGLYPSFTYFVFLFSIFNIGAPPSINFVRELLLLAAALKWCILLLLIMVLLSLVRGFYSVFLFCKLQHGKIWSIVSIKIIQKKDFLILCLHLFPLIYFISKSEVFILWV